MDENLYYQPTGKAPFSSILTSCILGAIAGLILGILYVALQWFIPIIYFNFLITLALGYGLFVALNFLHKNGKIRNLKIALLSTLIAALVALYVQWALFVSLMFQANGTMGDIWVKSSFNFDGFLYYLTHPKEMFEDIGVLNEYGTFSLKSSVVSGGFLWCIWIVEAAVIVGFPLILIFGSGQSRKPFSENQNSWMNARQLEGLFPFVVDKDVLISQFKNLNMEAVTVPLKEEEYSEQYALTSVFELEGDDDQYVTVTNITEQVDKKGEIKRKENIVVEYFRLPANTL